MGKIFIGAVIMLVILVLAGLGFAMLGFFPTAANVEPPHLEAHLAMSAVDASSDRHAPRVTNPLTPTDANLIDGMKLYTMNCSLCHGTLDRKPSTLVGSFYPPPPNLVSDPPDDPEWRIFYTVTTIIGLWQLSPDGKTLTEQEMWKVTMFLSHMDKLPPAVQDYWKTSVGVAPAAADEKKDEKKEEKHDHH